MPEIVMNAARMMECLPEEDQIFAYEFIKKLVLAWDPDFTKLTASEAAALKEAEEGEYVDDEDMDWDVILGNTEGDSSV